MNDNIAGLGIFALALIFLPTLIALLGARRFLPLIGVGTLNLVSLVSLAVLPMAVVFWFVALFVAIGASNRTRRDRQHDELIKVLKRQGPTVQAKTAQRIEPAMGDDTPKMGKSSFWPVPEKR